MAHPRDVPMITTAQRGRQADADSRLRRYLVLMSIRIVCIILAVVVPGWPKAIFIVGAVAIPYLAVVVANARDNRHDSGKTSFSGPDAKPGPPQLPPPAQT